MSLEEKLKGRAIAVEALIADGSKTAPNTFTPIMVEYWKALRLNKGDDYLYAHDIFKSTLRKDIIEALLLSTPDWDIITQLFGIPANIVEIYEHLFFDTSVFKYHLDKLDYVNSYSGAVESKDMRDKALRLGPYYIGFTYGHILPETDKQKEVLRRMYFTSAYRAVDALDQRQPEYIYKYADKFAKVMLDSFNTIEKMTSETTEGNMESLQKVLHSYSNTELNNKKDKDGKAVTSASLV